MWIDSHCHLDASEFDPDRDLVIADARAAGVAAQILPAIRAADWPQLKALCDRHAALFPAYGLHPMFLNDHRPNHLLALRQWIERERPIAVGECGLDYFLPELDPVAQGNYLRGQLDLAVEFDLPVIVHARRAVDAILLHLRRYAGRLRGVVHSYAGSEEQASQLFKLGFYLGIGGPVTYERAQRLRRLVTNMPIDFLILETDAPDQPPAWARGTRYTPANLVHIAEHIARLRNIDTLSLARATRLNTCNLFRLPVA
jgi:TatD DNase family protein